jgi:hypothetical protein
VDSIALCEDQPPRIRVRDLATQDRCSVRQGCLDFALGDGEISPALRSHAGAGPSRYVDTAIPAFHGRWRWRDGSAIRRSVGRCKLRSCAGGG